MYTFILVIHVIVSVFLIIVILFQAGRGGGLADSFGGSQMQNLFGTKSVSILTRLTTICASVFIVTCLSLAIISSHRATSVVDKLKIPKVAEPVDVTKPVTLPSEKKVESLPVVLDKVKEDARLTPPSGRDAQKIPKSGGE